MEHHNTAASDRDQHRAQTSASPDVSQHTPFSNFVHQFTSQDILARRIGRHYYLAEQRLWDMKHGIDRDLFSIGLYLGEEKHLFEPSPVMVELLSKMPEADSRKIFINKKAEWLFLCGRNLLPESVKNPNNLVSGFVLVQNERDENLGYGLFKQQDTLIIKNVLDKGKYLRMNEKGRK